MKALNLDNSDSFLMTSFLKAIPIFGGPLSGLICLGFGGCGTQVSPVSSANWNSFTQATTTRLNTLNASTIALTNFTNQVVANIALDNARVNSTLAVIAGFQQELNTTAAQLKNQFDLNTLVQSTLSNQLNTVQQNLGNVTSYISQFANQLNTQSSQWSSQIQSMFLGIQNVTNQTNFALANMSNVISSRIYLDESKLKSLVTQVNLLAGGVKDLSLETTRKRFMIRSVQNDIFTINQTNYYYPLLTNFGQAPANTLGQYAAVYMDTITRIWVSSYQGSTIANRLVKNWYCDTAFYLSYSFGFHTYQDILSSMIANCNPATPGLCQCWLTWQLTTCASSSGLATGSAFTDTNLWNGSLCIGSQSTQALQTIVNVTVLFANEATLCNTAPAISPGIFVYSNTSAVKELVPYEASICSMDLATTFEGISNVISVEFAILEKSFQNSLVNLDFYSNYIDGQMPDDISFVDNPFTYRNGVPSDCLTGYYMAYSNVSLPVYELSNPTTATAVVTVTVDGVALNTSNILLSVPDINILGNGQIRLIGNPLSTTFVYDAPQTSISFGSNPRERSNKLTYAMFCNNSCMTLACWKSCWQTNPNATTIFDHTRGSVVPLEYKRPYNPSTYLCTGTAYGSAGTWCTILSDYYVSGNSYYTQFEPKVASYLVTLQIPDGTLFSQMFSTCPTISIEKTSGAATTAVFANPTAEQTSIAYSVFGDCPIDTETLTIPAGATRSVIIPRCVASNVAQPQTYLNVYYFDQNGFQVLCDQGNALNVTTDRLTVIQTTGLPDTIYTQQTSVVTQDPLALSIAKIMTNLTAMLSTLTLLPIQVYQSNGMPVPASAFALTQNHLDNITLLNLQISQLLVTQRNQTLTNITQLSAPYLAEIAQDQIDQEKEDNATNILIAGLAEQNIEGTNEYSKLVEANSLFIHATDLYLLAESNFTNRLEVLLGSIMTGINNGAGFGFTTGWDAILNAIGHAILSGFSDALSFLDTLALNLIDWVINGIGSLFEWFIGQIDDIIGKLSPASFLGEIPSLVLFIFIIFFILLCVVLGGVFYWKNHKDIDFMHCKFKEVESE